MGANRLDATAVWDLGVFNAEASSFERAMQNIRLAPD